MQLKRSATLSTILFFFLIISTDLSGESKTLVSANQVPIKVAQMSTWELYVKVKMACRLPCRRNKFGNFRGKCKNKPNPRRCIFCRNVFKCGSTGSAVVSG